MWGGLLSLWQLYYKRKSRKSQELSSMYIVYIPFTLYCGKAAARAQPKRARYVYLAPTSAHSEVCCPLYWRAVVGGCRAVSWYHSLFGFYFCHRALPSALTLGLSLGYLLSVIIYYHISASLSSPFLNYFYSFYWNNDNVYSFFKALILGSGAWLKIQFPFVTN